MWILVWGENSNTADKYGPFETYRACFEFGKKLQEKMGSKNRWFCCWLRRPDINEV